MLFTPSMHARLEAKRRNIQVSSFFIALRFIKAISSWDWENFSIRLAFVDLICKWILNVAFTHFPRNRSDTFFFGEWTIERGNFSSSVIELYVFSPHSRPWFRVEKWWKSTPVNSIPFHFTGILLPLRIEGWIRKWCNKNNILLFVLIVMQWVCKTNKHLTVYESNL